MPSRSIIRTGVGPHREPGNRFPAMAAAINLLAARAARVQSRRNLSRSLSPKLDHSHSITRFDRSRTGPKNQGDLLSTLMDARDESGRPMPDRQLRDEAVTLLLAGHETTALALSWTFYLLGQHPEIDAELAAEVQSVLNDREAAVDDLPRLTFTEHVVTEAMRL